MNLQEVLKQSSNLAGSSPTPHRKKWFSKWWVILIFVILFILLVLAVALSFAVYDEIKNMDKPTGIDLTNQPIVPVSADDDPSRGPEDAKVIIIAFEDFECSYCEESYPVIKELLLTYKNQIRFVFRDFPALENSQKVHEAAECTDDQGRFWAMYDKIFENQDNLTVLDLKNYAEEIGLDAVSFADCLDSGKYEKEVQKDLTDGFVAGVSGTPTWFINGRKFAGAIPLETFKQIIDHYLKE
ncbi:MAG: hypothetical protein COT24_02540 [Candidatus Kerfeldbacteria bacterium CG08_land_8_20_14_0_20_40_16]|uniref:Thioredoxin domain-containing protein n=1 Tax=Candidatus Kerfeldbacteria bacterium CG08_land_8_20_14_0_20_40_16 TaxID=2014244 RepID=A0A2H0YY36_9BACT|nr:MAG: hypothetical protein COT24_02540 [Candidatus Kerfeldbacteria bacterium CG08_land_8_20_14_0_20_40_16]